MPNLHWNLENQEKTLKEEIQETQEMERLDKTWDVIITMMIFIYSYILQIQSIVFQYIKTAVEAIKQTVKTTKNISRTGWTKIQKEMQARLKHLRTHQENHKNQSYRSYDCHSEYAATQ